MGVENVPARRRGRAVSEADAQAAAQEIGAIAWTEISLGSEGAAAEAESVFTRLASTALALYLDPFSQLRAAAMSSSSSHGRQQQRSWHVPSADLRAAEGVELVRRRERVCPGDDGGEDERVPEGRRREGDRDALSRDERLIGLEACSGEVEIDDRTRALPCAALRAEHHTESDRPSPMGSEVRCAVLGAGRMGRDRRHGGAS